MLLELSVKDLGVIDSLVLELPLGMIALTGETGAGKTLLVDAISLLVGGRADPKMVRPGAKEASIDGRFELHGQEIILTRVVSAAGRSKAYIDGRPATVTAVAEVGASLLDLHGQHTHQSLLGAGAQRESLDQFANIDLAPLLEAKQTLTDIANRLEAMGGDERTRARELDLVRYQVTELEDAAIKEVDELDSLAQAEDELAHAVTHQEIATQALHSLVGEDNVDEKALRDLLAQCMEQMTDVSLFATVQSRLESLVSELDDVGDELRSISANIEQDPQKLEEIQTRRRLLRELCRKYGDDLPAVVAERDRLQNRLRELEDFDVLAAELDQQQKAANVALGEAQQKVRAAREAAAPQLAQAIEARLPELAMGKAKVAIEVAGDAGEEVSYLLSANPGSPLLPLAKVASGGELARTMLALRSVLSHSPPVLIFDEVDAGIGGETGFAVGRSLANLGDKHQVFVVSHLPQVAAFADAHLYVEKKQGEAETVSNARLLSDDQRVREVARMLSGQPDSASAQTHAKELLASAQAAKNG